VDIAFIPIGAYAPQLIMKPQHLDPFEAVQVHQDLEATLSIGMHWGTFPLSPEPILEPREKLRQAVANQNLSPDQFVTFDHGESRVISINTEQNIKAKFKNEELEQTLQPVMHL